MTDFSHPNAQAFRLGEGENACLLIHGFMGSPSHLRPMGEYLASRGFHVEGILLPGHGTKIQDMDRASWKLWLRTAQSAAARLRREHGKVYAAGLSMGGILSLLLGEEGLADAVVSMASPIRIYGAAKAMMARVAWPFMRYMTGKSAEIEGFLKEYDYGYDSMPVRRVTDLLRLMRMAERGLNRLECPLLVVQSLMDQAVRPISADIIYSRAASKHKEMMILERSPHVLTLGVEREAVFRRAGDYLCAIADK